MVIGKAIRNKIPVFPDVEAVLCVVEAPARHFRVAGIGRGLEFLCISSVVEQPAGRSQSPKAVNVCLRPGAYIPGNTDGGVKFHNRARYNAVERLNRRHLPKHSLIVHTLVNINTAFYIGVWQINVFPLVQGVGNDKVVGVIGLRFAEADEIGRVNHGNHGYGNHGNPIEHFPIPL